MIDYMQCNHEILLSFRYSCDIVTAVDLAVSVVAVVAALVLSATLVLPWRLLSIDVADSMIFALGVVCCCQCCCCCRSRHCYQFG